MVHIRVSTEDTKMYNYYRCIPHERNTKFEAMTPIIQRMYSNDLCHHDQTSRRGLAAPETVTHIDMAYQNTTNDLSGIEVFKNLKSLKIMGALGNLSPLRHCKQLEYLEIMDPGIIVCLEDLVDLPFLKKIRLGRYMTNYSQAEFDEIVSRFKHITIETSQPQQFNEQARMYTDKQRAINRRNEIVALISCNCMEIDLVRLVYNFV